jgi:hypothetical protein
LGKSANSGNGTAAAKARVIAPHAYVEESLKHATTPEAACAELSRIFKVRQGEVALLRVDKDALNFIYPLELKAAGSIPLSSSSAVAARTATTRKVELFNNFVIVQHANVFETIRLGTLPSGSPGSTTIQKLMSAPIINQENNARDNDVLGVIQLCHKGITPEAAGPDFTLNDLQNLESAAKVIAKLPFMQTGV